MEVYVKLELCFYILLCLKRNLMYANSTGTNYPVAKSIVTSEMVTTTEGSTLILKCPPSSSNHTTWKKSPPTDCRFTQYAEDNKINPSLEHANRLRVVGNFSIGIYNLQIVNVSLVDEGLYRCSYTYNKISHTKGIQVSVTKPPEVNVTAVISQFGKTRLDCLAQGIPALYNFSKWEHKSMFGEHIRYLDGFDNGTLLIQNKSKIKSYQDNGLYVCHVSNGVLNSNGSVVQMGEYVLRVESQPVFVMQTKRTQFGVDGQTASLIFHLYGYPPAKEVYVFAGDNKTEKIQIDEFERKTATVLDSFHDVVIHAIGYTINFEFDRLNETDARNYTIIAYNDYGKSTSFDFEIIPASVEEHMTSGPSFPNVVLLTSIVAGIVVFVIPTIIIYRTYWKKNENESADVEDVQMNVINQGIGPVENALYQAHDLQRNTRSSATYSTMEGRAKSQTGHSVVSYSTADSNGDTFFGGATNLHSKQPPMDLPDKDIGLSLSATGYNTPKDMLREQEHLQARQAKQFNNKELQYSELSFNPSSGPRFIIHGKNDKTIYSDVDLSIRVSPLPFADKNSDSDDKDDDFMYVDNIKKYTLKRSTQVKLNTK